MTIEEGQDRAACLWREDQALCTARLASLESAQRRLPAVPRPRASASFLSGLAGTEPAFSSGGITPVNSVPVDGNDVVALAPTDSRPVFRLTTDLGYEVTCIADQPIKTPGGFLPLKRLRPGDTVMLGASMAGEGTGIPQTIAYSALPFTTTAIPITERFAEFLGFYMGDGSFHEAQLSIVCDRQDIDVIERVRGLLAEFVGPPHTRVTGSQGGGLEIRVSRIDLIRPFDEMGLLRRTAGQGLKRKVHVPAYINAAPLPVARAFLRGLFEADGFAQRNGSGVKFFSKYPSFAREVQLLLLRFGITCRRTPHDKVAGNGSLYTGWELSLRMAEAALYAERIGFVSKRKQDRLANPPAPRGGYGLRRLPIASQAMVTTISPAGIAPVWAITTDSPEFNVGGVIVRSRPAGAVRTPTRRRCDATGDLFAVDSP